MRYRIVRNPGSTRWYIQRKGWITSTHKEYIGGGLSGYPVYGTKYFKTKLAANECMYQLLTADKDKGEICPWVKKP